ncbi:Hydroxyacyl-thioester dehydratase type 2 [Escovopsis weberi]|uniref:Hydroxyacyl-thioester dehydratase type 2 n=1 Tax=Escovopsis weberi TaxID=150374 RepID=A0A0M8N375_ESCWE|nr:Hydroxyacyl-thioester dehydratase type 2 [Escovopsis weberi]
MSSTRNLLSSRGTSSTKAKARALLARHVPWHLHLNPCRHALARAVHSGPEARGFVEPKSKSKSKTKIIRDVLSPTPSHLLTLLLSDMLRGGHEHATPPTAASDTAHHPPASEPSLDTHTYDSSPPASLFTAPRALPPGHSLVYFPLQAPASQLAPDGADADHVPEPRFSRRLWAGGELSFRRRGEPSSPGAAEGQGKGNGEGNGKGKGRLLLDGSPWTCREDVRGVKRSAGGAGGERYMVRLERLYARGLGAEAGSMDADWDWDIRETRTLVFKRGDAAMPHAPHAGEYAAHFTPTPAHLFHFSALTYNAHGIHIDPLAARRDGHPALLVHGPLTLALMLRVLGDRLGPRGGRVVNFAYRNYAPLYVAQRAAVRVRRIQRPEDGPARQDESYEVWIENGEGGVAASGTATVELEEPWYQARPRAAFMQ